MGEQPEQEQESRYQGVKVATPDGDGEQIITFPEATEWDVYEGRLIVYGSETDDPDDKNPVRIAEFPRNGWRQVWRMLREREDES